MVYWHIETDFVAIAIFLVLIFKAFLLNKEKTFTDRTFALTLILGFWGTVIDIVSSSIMNHPRNWWVYEVSMIAYLLFSPLLTVVWVIYTVSLVEKEETKAKRLVWIFVLPYFFYALLCVTNPAHELLFALNPELDYSRGPLFLWMVVGSQMFYAALGTVMILVRWKDIVPRCTGWLLIGLYVSATSSYWIQIANPGWLITCAAYAVVFLICDAVFETQRREKLYQSVSSSLKMAEDSNLELECMNEELRAANDALAQQIDITSAISSVFFASYTIDMATGAFKEINVTPEIHKVVGSSGYISQISRAVVGSLVDPGYGQEIEDFLDLATLDERIAGHKMISLEFIGRMTGWNRVSLIVQSRDAEGKLEKAICAVRHIDEEKKRELDYQKRLKEAAEEADRANRVKSDFLANMSHEIRTPLNAVVGMTEMILRESTQSQIKEYAVDIQQASNYLLSLINDILDISKIESGKLEIQESRYELGSLINDSYNMVATHCREKGLNITVSCDPKLPRLLYGDEYHMRQILVNLLTNAVKYTIEGGLELNVEGEENNDILRLEARVKDSGIGIRPEDIPRLFNKFDRFELHRNRRIEGTGLGLSITKQLVELMHGEITVESVYGVGTTFTVRVPQKIVDRTPIGNINTTYLDIHRDIEKYSQSFEAPESCILVVDDVPVNLQVVRKLLQATRIEVDTAVSGPECLKKICKRKYDLILMDHMMPEMDGIETMEAMQGLEDSLNKYVPVIMLTANAMQGAREDYLSQGFVDYLAKPIRGARLESIILKYLPGEKVHMLVEQTNMPEQTDPKGISFDRLAEELPEMDTAAGVAYCAEDKDFYCSILEDFIESERGLKLEQAYQSEDWDAYKLEAHSLKSAAKMVGLLELSEECAGLEQALRGEDVAYVRANHGDVTEHYRRVVESLGKCRDD